MGPITFKITDNFIAPVPYPMPIAGSNNPSGSWSFHKDQIVVAAFISCCMTQQYLCTVMGNAQYDITGHVQQIPDKLFRITKTFTAPVCPILPAGQIGPSSPQVFYKDTIVMGHYVNVQGQDVLCAIAKNGSWNYSYMVQGNAVPVASGTATIKPEGQGVLLGLNGPDQNKTPLLPNIEKKYPDPIEEEYPDMITTRRQYKLVGDGTKQVFSDQRTALKTYRKEIAKFQESLDKEEFTLEDDFTIKLLFRDIDDETGTKTPWNIFNIYTALAE